MTSIVNSDLFFNNTNNFIIQNTTGSLVFRGYSGTTQTFSNTYLTLNSISGALITNYNITVNNLNITASTGSQGSQGVQGLIGFGGLQGFIGNIGNQGKQGFMGNVGLTGLTGLNAVNSTLSKDGIQGVAGVQGITGFLGNQGITGITGLRGPQGPQGVNSLFGSIGSQGSQGPQGSQGVQGSQGPQGSQGVQGMNGYFGLTGLNGSTGSRGVQGIQGFMGSVSSSPSSTSSITGVNLYNQSYNYIASTGSTGALYLTSNVIDLTNNVTYLNQNSYILSSTGVITGLNKILVNDIYPAYYSYTGFIDRLYTGYLSATVNSIISVKNDLYIGGAFTALTTEGAVSLTLNRITKWSSTGFQRLWTGAGNVGLNDTVNTMSNTGDTLYIGGTFTDYGRGIAFYNTNSYTFTGLRDSLYNGSGANINATINSVIPVDDTYIYVGGKSFTGCGGTGSFGNICRFNLKTNRVEPLIDIQFGGTGVSYTTAATEGVSIIKQIENELYVGGLFTTAGGTGITSLAIWSGTGWTPPDRTGTFPLGTDILAIDYTGPLVYIGGDIDFLNGFSCANIVQYNRITRSFTGLRDTLFNKYGLGGITSAVNTIKVLDADNVAIGGNFSTPYGYNNVTIWNNKQKRFFQLTDPDYYYIGFSNNINSITTLNNNLIVGGTYTGVSFTGGISGFVGNNFRYLTQLVPNNKITITSNFVNSSTNKFNKLTLNNPKTTINLSYYLNNWYTKSIYGSATFSSVIPIIYDSSLQIYLNPADPQSYKGGTILYDLSGNGRNFTLIGDPTYSGSYFTYNSSSKYGVITTANLRFTNSASTIIAFIKSNASQPNYACFFLGRNAEGAYGNYIESNRVAYVWNARYQYNSNILLSTTRFSMVALRTTSAGATIYVNTTTSTDNTALTNPTNVVNEFRIAQDSFDSAGRSFFGDIGASLLYNRTLSDDEIIYTYNIFKSVYDLP